MSKVSGIFQIRFVSKRFRVTKFNEEGLCSEHHFRTLPEAQFHMLRLIGDAVRDHQKRNGTPKRTRG